MKNKKGFTLIELLAVIVILGLLMAIAIPSVTRYINQSRKKTLMSTIENYVTALTNEVNSLEYSFTETNTIYAVPIECISLEKGGNNPFGEWIQANDDYFAYVLVQYDEENESYIYGYTFKDSSGNGMYPMTQKKLDDKGSQINTGLSLNKPITSFITSLTEIENWQDSGFDVTKNTSLKVLEATSEGTEGNGKTTCTLVKKGDNYEEVEEEKKNNSNNNEIATPLYFGRKYTGNIEGEEDKFSVVFWEDGTVYGYTNDKFTDKAFFEVREDGVYQNGTLSIVISEDKKTITDVVTNDKFVLDENDNIPIHFGKIYKNQVGDSFIFHEDGSWSIDIDTTGTFVKYDNFFRYVGCDIFVEDEIVLKSSKDGKTITLISDGSIITLNE